MRRSYFRPWTPIWSATWASRASVSGIRYSSSRWRIASATAAARSETPSFS